MDAFANVQEHDVNTEIGKTGEVIVEGHVIGRLDGFTFAPDAAEAGSDAKALQATALKALAGEIDARAEKLAKALTISSCWRPTASSAGLATRLRNWWRPTISCIRGFASSPMSG